MAANNVLTAVFGGSRATKTPPLYQYDYGQKIVLKGISGLPIAYEMHFSNAEYGESKTSIGDEDGVIIPNEYLTSGEDIHAWLFLHTGQDDGETEYKLTIPVRKRARPTDTEPAPVQQDVITQAIAVLNDAIERTGESAGEAADYASDAKGYSESAEASASQASASEVNSLAYAQRAEQGASQAATSANRANEHEQSAHAYSQAAYQSAVDADMSADRAEQAATTAGYMYVEIIDGRLIYTKTDTVDVDFVLEDGRLIMEE